VCIRSWLLAKDSEVRGKPLQLRRTCHRRTLRKTKTARKATGNHPGWTSWCKGRLTEADTPTIRLGASPSGLSSAHLHHPLD